MPFVDSADVRRQLDAVDYLVDEGLATALYFALALKQPLLLEGEPGVGKTTAAKALARALDAPLIRLQCYEGLTVSEALYEWNYQRQLLAIRLAESRQEKLTDADLFTEEFLHLFSRLRECCATRRAGPIEPPRDFAPTNFLRAQISSSFHAVQERVDRAWTQMVSVSLQLLDYAEAENRLLACVIKNMNADKSRQKFLIPLAPKFSQPHILIIDSR